MERDEGRLSQVLHLKFPQIPCHFGYFLTDAKMLFLYNGTFSYDHLVNKATSSIRPI